MLLLHNTVHWLYFGHKSRHSVAHRRCSKHRVCYDVDIQEKLWRLWYVCCLDQISAQLVSHNCCILLLTSTTECSLVFVQKLSMLMDEMR